MHHPIINIGRVDLTRLGATAEVFLLVRYGLRRRRLAYGVGVFVLIKILFWRKEGGEKEGRAVYLAER